MSAVVKTSFVYPPIPIRSHDWSAWWDGHEELGSGSGATEQEAIDDLLEWHPPCKNGSPYVDAGGNCLRCGVENAFIGPDSECRKAP